jgi:serine/threonine protein kinase
MEFETGLHVGDFCVEQRLGAGGMGVVYRARQISLNRVVALKVLGGSIQTETGVARFRREAQAIAKLKHPNIAGILYLGQDEKICYMVMEFVDGVSFREVIRRARNASNTSSTLDDTVWESIETMPNNVVRFDVETTDQGNLDVTPSKNELSLEACKLIAQASYIRRCVEMVRDVALALSYAHEHSVVHRDVKPENLLLDRTRKVTVIDFGLARFYDDETITYTGQLVGTPLYMSPEQILGGKEITGQSDVYSLGMVLYELLTLEPPMEAPNRESLFRHIVTRPLAPVSWKNPAVPDALMAIVHHSLAKDTEVRYQTMATFSEDLQKYLLGKPVAAPPYRFRFDEEEIRAKRPSAVLYLAFLCFFMGIMIAVPATITTFASFFFNDRKLIYLIFLSMIFLGLTVSVFCYGHSLLAGQKWTKTIGYAYGIFFSDSHGRMSRSIRLQQFSFDFRNTQEFFTADCDFWRLVIASFSWSTPSPTCSRLV